MLQFPSSRNDWRFDVVSILAVLGESNIRINYQVVTASRFYLLPRLIPPPQAFLREKRPKHLVSASDVNVYGVQSGNTRWGVIHLARMLHEIDSARAFSIREVTITKTNEKFLARIGRWHSPTNLLAISSCLLSIGLLVLAALLRDGVALTGILIMSLAFSALGLASLWQRVLPYLPHRKESKGRDIDDIVLQTHWGAFLVVHCDMDIARQLYWTPEECAYRVSDINYRITGGVLGGLAITVGIVPFDNCSWVMQIAIRVSYAALNMIYWFISSLPPSWSWDFSRLSMKHIDHQATTFTSAIYLAIQLTNQQNGFGQTKLHRTQTLGWIS